jgi:hypothetical protein
MNLERRSHWNHRQIRRPISDPRKIRRRASDPRHTSGSEQGTQNLGGSFSRYQTLAKGPINFLLSSIHAFVIFSLMAACATIIALFSLAKGPFRRYYTFNSDGTFEPITPHIAAIIFPIFVLTLYILVIIGMMMMATLITGGRLQLVPRPRGDGTAERIDRSAFLSIQRAIRTRRAGEPRDKSYGLYGVMKALGVGLAQANYSKPIGLVYQELCLDLLRWGRSLNLILDSGLPGFPEVASWTPVWESANAPVTAWLDPTYVYSTHGQKTTAESLPIWRLVGNSQLVVRGCFRGSVIFCSAPFEKDQDIASRLLDAFNEIRLRIRLQKESDTVYAALFEVLYARVMSRAPPGKSEAFNYWFQSLVAASSLTIGARAQLLHWSDTIQRSNASETYHRDIGVQLAGRILFVTSDGLLGTGPCTVDVGDHVMLGSGIAMPLVLRRNELSGSYEHVGPAFIHGMMEGSCGQERIWKMLS